MIYLNGNTKIEFSDKNIYKDVGTTAVHECHIYKDNKNEKAVLDDINQEPKVQLTVSLVQTK